MSGLAGTLRTRLSVLRRGAATDALGGNVGDWAEVALVRADARPVATPGAAADGAVLGRWRVTMRPCGIAAGDRLAGDGLDLAVVRVTRDPAIPDRIAVDAEERR